MPKQVMFSDEGRAALLRNDHGHFVDVGTPEGRTVRIDGPPFGTWAHPTNSIASAATRAGKRFILPRSGIRRERRTRAPTRAPS